MTAFPVVVQCYVWLFSKLLFLHCAGAAPVQPAALAETQPLLRDAARSDDFADLPELVPIEDLEVGEGIIQAEIGAGNQQNSSNSTNSVNASNSNSNSNSNISTSSGNHNTNVSATSLSDAVAGFSAEEQQQDGTIEALFLQGIRRFLDQEAAQAAARAEEESDEEEEGEDGEGLCVSCFWLRMCQLMIFLRLHRVNVVNCLHIED